MTTSADRAAARRLNPSEPSRAVGATRATIARWTATAAAAAGLALVLFPVLRPWPDEAVTSGALATAFASERWVLAHLCGILGLGLLAPMLLGLRALAPAQPQRTALAGAVATAWAGAGLSALYFGAEIFGIHTIARATLRTGDLGLLVDVDALRTQPVAMAVFGAGLLLLAVAGVLAAIALWRWGARPRWAGVLLAVALVLYLPQFFGTPALRIAHGALAAVALLLVAVVAVRLGRTAVDGAPGADG